MSNQMNLKELVEDKLQAIVDEIVENRQDLHHDSEDTFDVYFEEMFNSHADWWEFEQSELNIDNINEVLESYEIMKEEFGELPTEQPLSVHYLLTLYGYWFGKTLKDKYVNILKDAFEQNEEQSE